MRFCGIDALYKKRDLIIGLTVGLGGGLILIGLGIGAYCWYKKRKLRAASKVTFINDERNPQMSATGEIKVADKTENDVSALQDTETFTVNPKLGEKPTPQIKINE